MAAYYRPNNPFNVPMKVCVPTIEVVKGVRKKKFDNNQSFTIVGSFKSYGGTETVVNGVLSVVDTAEVECWYNPLIKSDCEIVICESGERYELLGKPEDISMRHQFLKFKVKRIAGGA